MWSPSRRSQALFYLGFGVKPFLNEWIRGSDVMEEVGHWPTLSFD
jgi:hypothetical protein